MTDSILDQPEVAEDHPQVDPTKDYLAELVGEGKKFKDERELARAKYESDSYIKILERRLDNTREDALNSQEENIKLRGDINKRASLQEMIDILSKQQISNNDNTQRVNEPSEKPAIGPEEIDKRIFSSIQQYEVAKMQKNNADLIRAKLTERYGDNYVTVLKQQVQDLGLTPEFADNLAKTSPKAFLQTFGLNEQPREEFQSPLRSSQRRDNFAPNTTKRTWSYYQKMRKEQPDLYNNPKTAIQMQEDYISQGRAFEDGDFYN